MSLNRGGRHAEPPLVRLVEILEDGEWHFFDEVVREVGKVIPPGRAVRQNEMDRRQAGGPEGRRYELSRERAIESGRRTILRGLIGNGKGRYFEIDPPGRPGQRRPPDTLIRMKEMPASVARDRRLAAEAKLVGDDLVDRLIKSSDPAAELAVFDSRRAMERVALALLRRLRGEDDE